MVISPERDAVFADFYKRFKDYLLVIDKWFSLRQRRARPGINDDLKTLRQHPVSCSVIEPCTHSVLLQCVGFVHGRW